MDLVFSESHHEQDQHERQLAHRSACARKNNDALNTSLERLSTGLKINSGADDPAGLIASENLKAEQAGINTAIDNANRAPTSSARPKVA